MNANFIICKKLIASENSRRRSPSYMFDANCAQLIQTSTFRKNHRRDEISALGLVRAHDWDATLLFRRCRLDERQTTARLIDPGPTPGFRVNCTL